VLLVAHSLYYWFLTDDAYISFRYARNLAEGQGLVFNPGFERVEGYTNLLWVLVLAAAHRAGLPIEQVAPVLSLAATLGLGSLVARAAWLWTPAERRAWALLPVALLAATRSVAVWSTSGLETRLFELLVFGGVLRLWLEDTRLGAGERAAPLAAVLLGLATLTRPDGLLIALCAFGATALHRVRALRARLGWLAGSAAVYAALVGGQLLFRWSYYGAWLPNTYYAKVDGRLWWDAGLRYAEAFALEYGLYLWLPFLAAGVVYHVRRGRALVPLLFAAVTLPHALYVVSIGGDHFEYRPFDLYFPFAYLLLAAGALELARTAAWKGAVLAALALVAAFLIELPLRSHLEFPDVYMSGFPGQWARLPGEVGEPFLDPDQTLLYRLPGLRAIAKRHQILLRSLSREFIGIRQEEHALFLGTVVPEGRALADLIAEGRIPPDAFVAIDCVGAIPYYSRLRVLDRLGLTDAEVAHAPFVHPDIMAHGKYASVDEARRRGVDLWGADHVHVLIDVAKPGFAEQAASLAAQRREFFFARLDPRRYLVAQLPQGLARTAQRFPRLRLRSNLDPEALRELEQDALAAAAP
jgi:arabinofuranosyltransferase